MLNTIVTLVVYIAVMFTIADVSPVICNNSQYAQLRPIYVPVVNRDYAPVVDDKPRPQAYKFPHEKGVEYGQRVAKTETKDGNGLIKGSYSYIDLAGVERKVDYVGDATTAAVTTNENQSVGIGTDVELEVQSPRLGSVRKRIQAQARAPQQMVYKILAPTQTPAAAQPESTLEMIVTRLSDIFESTRSFISNNVLKRLFGTIDLAINRTI